MLSCLEVRPVRCLYCGIKLKIAEKAKVIRHCCPECSVRIEYEGRHEALIRAEDRNRSALAGNSRRLATVASMKSS
jgi:DNA-directed RNA polymerase subunit RPC12/RpoP